MQARTPKSNTIYADISMKRRPSIIPHVKETSPICWSRYTIIPHVKETSPICWSRCALKSWNLSRDYKSRSLRRIRSRLYGYSYSWASTSTCWR